MVMFGSWIPLVQFEKTSCFLVFEFITFALKSLACSSLKSAKYCNDFSLILIVLVSPFLVEPNIDHSFHASHPYFYII